MASLFKSKKKKQQPPAAATLPKRRNTDPATLTPAATRIDELGRVVTSPPPPAFLQNPVPPRPSLDDSTAASHQHNTHDDGEMQLMYGYWGLYTQIELDMVATEQVVSMVAEQIKLRGLECPLLFSTKALDSSAEATHVLIKSYMTNKPEFKNDVQIATPVVLAAFLKWALGRHVNPLGTRGFLRWEKYETWRTGEKERAYPLRFVTTHLLYHLPLQNASLLTTLLDLLSSAAAYSSKNGMTVHKSSTLFSSYVFGLADDQPFERTYATWIKQSHAVEHLVLAYIRDQKATATTGVIPSRLEAYITNYPACIPNLHRPMQAARIESVARIRRHARFYNKNLIQSAATWDVPRSKTWDRLQPFPISSKSLGSSSTLATSPIMTKSYRHLLNIHAGNEWEDDEQDIEMQRFRSLVEKEWTGFMAKGFQEPKTDKLQFDLSETERSRRLKHATLDWSSFLGTGFEGRETYLPTDLEFSQNLGLTIHSWPEEKKELVRKLHKTNKSLPPFPYDITPQEEASLSIDENFFEAWSDSLVSSGWSRDEFKESNWTLVQYKCRPSHGKPEIDLSSGQDGRTGEVWVLIEEIVPEAYRIDLMEGKNKKSKRPTFLRVVTSKRGGGNVSTVGIGGGETNQKLAEKYAMVNPGLGQGAQVVPVGTSPFGGPYPTSRHQSDDIFDLRPGETRHMTLSKNKLLQEDASTVAGTIGHDSIPTSPVPGPMAAPRSPFSGGGIGGTYTSQGSGVVVVSDEISPSSTASPLGSTFMSNFRAKAKKRQDSYRIPTAAQSLSPSTANSPGSQNTAFEYDERTVIDPDTRLAPPVRKEGSTLRSPSADAWVDVTRKDEESRLGASGSGPYGRQAYDQQSVSSRGGVVTTPRPASSSVQSQDYPVNHSQQYLARPKNPSPPGSPETQRERRPAPVRWNEADPTNRETRYPEADEDHYGEEEEEDVTAIHVGKSSQVTSGKIVVVSESDDDEDEDADSPYDGVVKNPQFMGGASSSSTSVPRVIQASRIPITTTSSSLKPPVGPSNQKWSSLGQQPNRNVGVGLPRSPRSPREGGMPLPLQRVNTSSSQSPPINRTPSPRLNVEHAMPQQPTSAGKGSGGLRSMATSPSQNRYIPQLNDTTTPSSSLPPSPNPNSSTTSKKVKATSPFQGHAAKVSSIVDMFEGSK